MAVKQERQARGGEEMGESSMRDTLSPMPSTTQQWGAESWKGRSPMSLEPTRGRGQQKGQIPRQVPVGNGTSAVHVEKMGVGWGANAGQPVQRVPWQRCNGRNAVVITVKERRGVAAKKINSRAGGTEGGSELCCRRAQQVYIRSGGRGWVSQEVTLGGKVES